MPTSSPGAERRSPIDKYDSFCFYTISASIFQGTRVFQPQFFLLDQPICNLCYKMYACNRTYHQRQKRKGAGAIIASRADYHDYGQDRDERHSNIYRYNSDYVHMFDSIGIIKLDASQNRSLSRVGKATVTATSKNIWGAFKGFRYNEILLQKNK